MADRIDYSGPFDPKLQVDDLSKETLIKIWKSAAQLFVGIATLYLEDLRKRHGDKVAFEINEEIWRKIIPLEVKFVTEAINSHENDVAAYFKFLQCYALAGGQMDAMDFDLKDKNDGIFTVRHCQAFSGEFDDKTIKHYCEMCHWGWQLQANTINPDMKMTCLKPPPEPPLTNKEDIICQWRYQL